MKKKGIALLMGLISAVSLTGCASKAGQFNNCCTDRIDKSSGRNNNSKSGAGRRKSGHLFT